jgi:proline dehydrogenase
MSLAMAERNTTARTAGARRPDDARPRREPTDVRRVDELLLAYHRGGDRAAREQVLVELMPLVR